MIEALSGLVGGSYAPHGYCLLWQPWLVWTMAISDTLIALAYFSIPVALVVFVRKRRDVAFGGVFWLFALFILACGLTHVVALWNLWNGDYGLEAIVKLITASASVVTALLLWPLLPKALALPSPAHLREANKALHAQIVEREKAEAALIQAQKMEAVGQLTGGIAHDFNNLLQVVHGSLDLIRARGKTDEKLCKVVDTALAAVERGRRLTNQLLSFSRTQQLVLREVRISELLARLKEMLRRTIDPSIELRIESDDSAYSVLADEVQFELAILNLALNARDAMPEGGTLTIAVSNQRLSGRDDVADGDYLGVTVSDTGVGMAPDVAARVFEPFFTTKAVGQGSGLGLSMVFGMARQSGGSVTIESQPGRGSAFTIFMQRAVPVETVPVTAAAIRENSDALSGRIVLLVDDEPIVREVVSSMLEDLGCVVVRAENGPQALSLLDMHAPDLLMLDLSMPGMTGDEVARIASARWPDLPVIFATGFGRSDPLAPKLREKAALLRKPFSPDELAQALLQALFR